MSESKKEKIAKLLALANGNNNEAEAMAALGRATKMAEELGLNLADIKADNKEAKAFRATGAKFSGFGNRARTAADGWLCWAAVDWFLWKDLARFCTVIPRIARDADGDNTIEFFGHEADLELHQYLRRKLDQAMVWEFSIYKAAFMADLPDTAKAVLVAKRSFYEAMAGRLRQRMADITATMVGGNTGTSLVVLKGALVQKRAQELGFVEHHGTKGTAYSVDQKAYAAGRDAGNRANFGRGVGQSATGSAPKAIASR